LITAGFQPSVALFITAGPAFNQWCSRYYHCPIGVRSGGDDRDINTGLAYSPAVIVEASTLDGHIIRR
jgi:hypothetical protein